MSNLICKILGHKMMGHDLAKTRVEALNRMVRGLPIFKSYRCCRCGHTVGSP